MSFAKAQDLLKLAMMATRRSGVSLEEIVEEFGCVHRSAQRMTVALEMAFPQTEQEDGDDRKRRWRIPARAVAPLLLPSAEELAAMTTAIRQLDAAGMVSESATVRQMERKVRALIPAHAGTRLAVDEEALLEALGHAARPGPRPAGTSEVDSAISESLKGPFLLRISYRRRTQDKPTERVVAPHGLLLGVRRYLVARDTAKPATAPLRHYRVEEIYSAEVLDTSFEIDPGFNIREHSEKGFGSFENAAEHGDVVWRFSPDAAPHARRFVFHPSQSVEEEPDGSLLVRFKASGHLEMCWHLYSWGKSVEVLQPARLREMVHELVTSFASCGQDCVGVGIAIERHGKNGSCADNLEFGLFVRKFRLGRFLRRLLSSDYLNNADAEQPNQAPLPPFQFLHRERVL